MKKIISFVFLLCSFNSISQRINCENELLNKASSFASNNRISDQSPSNLSIPFYFTKDQLLNIIDSITPNVIAEFKQTGPFEVDLLDSKGIKIGKKTIEKAEYGYGVFKNRNFNCQLVNDEILLDIPIDLYSYLQIEFTTPESFFAISQIILELSNKGLPELARAANNFVKDGLYKLSDELIPDPKVRRAFKDFVDISNSAIGVGIDIYQLNLDLTHSTQVYGISLIENSIKGLERLYRGDLNGAKASFDTMVESTGDLLNYLNEKTGALNAIKVPLDLGADLTTKTLKETTKLLSNTVEELGRAGKKLEKAGKKFEKSLKKTGKKIERGVRKFFKKPFGSINNSWDLEYYNDLVSVDDSFYELDYNDPLKEIANVFNGMLGQKYIISCGKKGEKTTVRIKNKLKLTFQNDFNLKLTNEVSDINWGNNCSMIDLPLVGGLLKDEIDELVKKQINKLISGLDESLSLNENLKKEWAKSQKIQEFKNDKTGDITYLRYNPKHLAINGISTKKDTAYIKAQIQAFPKISFNKPFDAQLNPVPFPSENKLVSDFDEGFNLNFEIDITYEDLIKDAKEKYKNKSLNIEFKILKRKKVKTRISKLKDFKIYAHEDKIIFGLCLKGFVRGLVFIEGTPRYNEERGIIYLEGLKWTTETKRNLSLLKLIDFTLNEKLRLRLNSLVRYNLAQDIKPKISELNEKYFNQDKGLILNGKLIKVALSDIFPHDDLLKVFINISAEIESITLD